MSRFWILSSIGLLSMGFLLSGSAHGQTCSNLELLHDVRNCGSCGNACASGSENAIWACNQGNCEFLGCQSGFHDTDGDQSCETACDFNAATEICNGIDDDCDGLIDEDPAPPPTHLACNVSLSATAAECTSGVALACVEGAWECTFPANVCVGGCSADDEICDLLDNDCDGSLNENVPNYGAPCRSDDGLPLPGHGRCATQGSFVCDGPEASVCSAVKADCATLPGGCAEACDGQDNDCDGLIDESFMAPGPDPTRFVVPEVTQIAADRWMFSFEASRPDASLIQPGFGNGYTCQGTDCPAGIPPAPAGRTLDATPACSEPDRQPWFGVTPAEVEQICHALGGFVCDTVDYRLACEATANCRWGYSPSGTACQSPFTVSTYCNLAVSFDFDPGSAGDQQGLLETASAELESCWADWGTVFPSNHALHDVTGNLREITKAGTDVYPLMGGSFLTEIEDGAACDFDFLVGDQTLRGADAGFRCCFDSDPSL